MSSKNKKLNLDKDTLYDLYVNQKMDSKQVAQILGCSSKSVRNYLNRYNIPVRQNGEAVKLERSHWSIEKENNRSLAYMQTWKNKSQKEKDAIAKKQGNYPNNNSPEAIAKARLTKLNNNSYIKSKSENNFYEKLLLFDNENIIRGYIDTRYPFNCDFYIKSKDLFIEYQGHYTHGYCPFNENDTSHLNYLEAMESKGVDMSTWTKRDVNKLNIAKKNRIKLLLIYPKHDSYLVSNGKIENINKIDMFDINDIK